MEGSDGFVGTDDGVRNGGVHDADLRQQICGKSQDMLPLVNDFTFPGFPITQNVDLGSGLAILPLSLYTFVREHFLGKVV